MIHRTEFSSGEFHSRTVNLVFSYPYSALGPFLEGIKKISHPETRSKFSNLAIVITALLYSDILNAKRGSLPTKTFQALTSSCF